MSEKKLLDIGTLLGVSPKFTSYFKVLIYGGKIGCVKSPKRATS